MLAASVPLAKTLLAPARVVDVVAQADRMRGARNQAAPVPHPAAVLVVVALVDRAQAAREPPAVARALPGRRQVAVLSSAARARAARVVHSDLPVADLQLPEARPHTMCGRASGTGADAVAGRGAYLARSPFFCRWRPVGWIISFVSFCGLRNGDGRDVTAVQGPRGASQPAS